MKKEKLKFFQKLLINKQNETLKSIDYLLENLQNTQSEQNESHKQSNQLEDINTDSYDQSNIIVLLNREKKYLLQIQDSLKEIDEGKYGICKMCGKEIMDKRLEAVPTTSMCIHCKQKEKSHSLESYE
jgi:RNA polymerase-binding protein DksA